MGRRFVFFMTVLAALLARVSVGCADPNHDRPSHRPWYALEEPENIHFPFEFESIDNTLRASRFAGPKVDWIYLFVYRSDLHVRYASPWAMATSITLGNFDNFASVMDGSIEIGHFEFAWSCAPRTLPNGLRVDASGVTGHTGDANETAPGMIASGGGLSPLFYDYTDGYLESEAMVVQRFRRSHETIKLLAVAVSPEQCRKVDDFVRRELKTSAYDHFSILADPAKFEGGVCWTTAKAATEHVPLLKSFFESYQFQIDIPRKFMGRPHRLADIAKLPSGFEEGNFPSLDFQGFYRQTGDWRTTLPNEPTYRYRNFDFAGFQRDVDGRFQDCQKAWCRDRPTIARTISAGGLEVETVLLNAL